MLADKVALITGAASGIGRATAILFSEKGARVVIADCARESGEETVKLIKNSAGEAMFVEGDVSKAADAERIVKAAIERYGKLDILVNNAGIFLGTTVTETTEEEWDKVINVNLKGVFLCSKYAIPEMMKTGGGVILNMGSIESFIGFPRHAAYGASKGGVMTLTKQMALDYAAYGIRVNCICPGPIETPAIKKARAIHMADVPPEKRDQLVLEKIPLRRSGKPMDVAHMAVYLASDEASFVTGSALVIDGGYTAQ